jgi:arginine/ornithine N-succinyltransferase beta subunit
VIPNLLPELLKTMVPTILAGGVFIIAVEYLKLRIERKIRERRGETTSERIEKLSHALTDATNLIGSIERELKERHQLVEKLRQDCVRYDQLAKLKSTEVDAVVQSLRGELRQEGKKAFWQSAGLNFLFFLAGIVVTKYVA